MKPYQFYLLLGLIFTAGAFFSVSRTAVSVMLCGAIVCVVIACGKDEELWD